MKVIIATDHNGVNEKKVIIDNLKERYEVIDGSPENYDTDDYPAFAFKVGEYVSNNSDTYGILLCGTGIGMSIAANKVKGIRAAHVSNLAEAKLARMHNDANIICMSCRTNMNELLDSINAFLITDFANEEKYIRRVNMIKEYESDN